MRPWKHAWTSALLLGFCACATLVSGTTQELSIESNPSGAAVAINNAEAGVTPLRVTLPRREDYYVRLSLDGYVTETRRTRRTINPWYFGNVPWALVLVGYVGGVVDLLNGSANEITPASIRVDLLETRPRDASTPGAGETPSP